VHIISFHAVSCRLCITEVLVVSFLFSCVVVVLQVRVLVSLILVLEVSSRFALSLTDETSWVVVCFLLPVSVEIWYPCGFCNGVCHVCVHIS
jgi:hypothetical protein